MVYIGKVAIADFPVILAPMEDITDASFRGICKQLGADLMFTEFASSDALIRQVEKSKVKIQIQQHERPIGIQLFGNNADVMADAAQIAEAAQPDIIDLNFGCPVKKIAGKGAGAGLLADVPKMLEITRAVVNATKLAVTVKTRLGINEKNKIIVELAERLQDCGIKALTIHGRTKEQMYKGLADWSLIGEVKNNPRMHIPIFGNGDVTSPLKAWEMKSKYGVDGIMIGRASIGNPWIFKEVKHYLQTQEFLPLPDICEKINICERQLLQAVAIKGEKRAIIEMRCHYSNYFKGLPNFKPFRMQLMNTNELQEIQLILSNIKAAYLIN